MVYWNDVSTSVRVLCRYNYLPVIRGLDIIMPSKKKELSKNVFENFPKTPKFYVVKKFL